MSMMLRRQMMVPKAGGDWRDLYQQVAYLQSSGTQYIDTGVIFNAGIKILARMGWTTSNRIETLFGARVDTGATRFLLCNYSGIDYAYRDDYVWNDYTAGTMYSFVYDTTVTNTFTYGTSAGTKTTSPVTQNTNTTGYIFAYHRASDDTVQSYASAKCESFVIENATGTKLRDMIPCYRKADNKPGMYDTVSGTFYTNAGAGEFVVGPDVTPEGYIKDGLVLFLDGIQKGSTPGTWTDRIGAHDFSGVGSPVFGTDYVQFGGSNYLQNQTFTTPYDSAGTIEVSASGFAMGSNQVLYMSNGYALAFGIFGTKGIIWSSGNELPVLETPNGFKTISITSGLSVVDGIDGTFDSSDKRYWSGASNTTYIGKRSTGTNFSGKVHAIRIYNKHLTKDEMLHNQRIDNARFNLGLTI